MSSRKEAWQAPSQACRGILLYYSHFKLLLKNMETKMKNFPTNSQQLFHRSLILFSFKTSKPTCTFGFWFYHLLLLLWRQTLRTFILLLFNIVYTGLSQFAPTNLGIVADLAPSIPGTTRFFLCLQAPSYCDRLWFLHQAGFGQAFCCRARSKLKISFPCFALPQTKINICFCSSLIPPTADNKQLTSFHHT